MRGSVPLPGFRPLRKRESTAEDGVTPRARRGAVSTSFSPSWGNQSEFTEAKNKRCKHLLLSFFVNGAFLSLLVTLGF
jgi:hypothetical protein